MHCLGGDQLRKLDLQSCGEIDPITELLPNCKQLESLAMENCNFISINAAEFSKRVPPAVLADSSNQFLPRLRNLTSKLTCFGPWSPLFDCHRPSLMSLDVNCFHIGLPGVSRVSWIDTPNLWPHLQQIGFYEGWGICALNAINGIAPHLNGFRQLETLSIPHLISVQSFSTGKNQKNKIASTKTLSPLDELLNKSTNHPLPLGLRIFQDSELSSSKERPTCLYHDREAWSKLFVLEHCYPNYYYL